MDYEKKYKEALEKFKKFKEKYFTYGRIGFGDVICDKTGTAQDELDAIFPELKESDDERIRKGLIEALKASKTVGELKFVLPYPEREECIAYLEKQKEPKQEWSEADEVYLQDALWCVEQATKVAKGENDMGSCWSAERWLKSLRPSWRPTEEQMDSLRDTIVQTKGYSYSIYLPELYEQLKKL